VRGCGGMRSCVREAGGRRREGLREGGWAEKIKVRSEREEG
jgi:hypothetical protein